MRLVGLLPAQHEPLPLLVHLEKDRGLEVELRRDDDGRAAFWVLDEDHRQLATQVLDDYVADPSAPAFVDAAAQVGLATERHAERLRRRAQLETQRRRRAPWHRPVTVSLLLTCSVIAIVVSLLGADTVTASLAPGGRPSLTDAWRLLTASLLPVNALHLFFSLLWLHELGGLLESRFGSARLALAMVVLALVGNGAEMLAVGPELGGLSTVLAGLFGFVVVRRRLGPASGLVLPVTTELAIGTWLLLSLTGTLGSSGVVGPLVGLAIGLSSALVQEARRRRLRALTV